MKYKVGDKVKVRSDLRFDNRYGTKIYTRPMLGFTEVTIRLVADDIYYVLENEHNYTDEMLDGLVEEKADKIIFTSEELKILKQSLIVFNKTINLEIYNLGKRGVSVNDITTIEKYVDKLRRNRKLIEKIERKEVDEDEI